MDEVRILEIKQSVFKNNDEQADKLRRTAEGLRRSAKPDAQQRADAAEALVREIEEKRDTL